MNILAIMLMRYNIAPESRRLDMPEKDLVVSAAIMPPKTGLATEMDLQIGGSECKATVTMWMIMKPRLHSK